MNKNVQQTYIIFSVDTEHDTIANHITQTAGWSNGIPLLLETFDIIGMRGKVCWLIEYNIKEGIPARNTSSVFFVKELPELIAQIRLRGDEIGIHPTMFDWFGKEEISLSSYKQTDSWDLRRSYYDPRFVINVINSAVKETKIISGINPVGCRTARFHYAIHLATALEKNGISVDSSVIQKSIKFMIEPHAYYASEEDIRRKSIASNKVLEIPSIGFSQFNINRIFTRIKIEFLLSLRKPNFLSLYIHNWDAITSNGMKNNNFLDNLTSFLKFLRNRGACFLSWTEAKEKFDSIYGTNDYREKYRKR
jgi:hypothetical protein